METLNKSPPSRSRASFRPSPFKQAGLQASKDRFEEHASDFTAQDAPRAFIACLRLWASSRLAKPNSENSCASFFASPR